MSECDTDCTSKTTRTDEVLITTGSKKKSNLTCISHASCRCIVFQTKTLRNIFDWLNAQTRQRYTIILSAFCVPDAWERLCSPLFADFQPPEYLLTLLIPRRYLATNSDNMDFMNERFQLGLSLQMVLMRIPMVSRCSAKRKPALLSTKETWRE
ncbi:hypothetical protein ABVK25_000003 [Lepraria finkii]|uniref:Uncharacterized protein n=1 Tax=Lepraria finkii TaxID=1340010 RepID=A0ABR4BMW3_9LECA